MPTEFPAPRALRERYPHTFTPDSATLEMDRLFRLLSDYRRRHLLTYLSRHEEWTQLSTVADYIVTRELGLNPETVPEERKRLYLSLYHTHVPKLVEPGYVYYDGEHDCVRPAPGLDRLAPFLELTY